MQAFIIGAGATLLGTLLNLILKKWVTDENVTKWGIAVEKAFKAIGTAVTLGISKMPYAKDVWNSIVEPYVIIVLRVVVSNMVTGLIQGLETDKQSFKKEKGK